MDRRAARHKLVFALDYPDLALAEAGARLVAASAGVLKIGLELFVKEGPRAVAMAQALDCEVFLDLKLHDIPQTVERAVASAASLGVRYLTVHAAGGRGMMEAAARRAESANGLILLGVTVLTSLGDEDLPPLGLSGSAADHAARLALLAQESGLGGLVCSAQEVGAVRALVGPDMVLCTPGIRPGGVAMFDQKRIATPAIAVRQGSDLLVVGRPIRDATNPAVEAARILAEIAEAS